MTNNFGYKIDTNLRCSSLFHVNCNYLSLVNEDDRLVLNKYTLHFVNIMGEIELFGTVC